MLSGWYFNEVVQLEFHTVEFNPTEGSSYLPLPDWITNKKAIINIQNKDEKCFLWCILRYLHPVDEKDNRLTDLTFFHKTLLNQDNHFRTFLHQTHNYLDRKINPYNHVIVILETL